MKIVDTIVRRFMIGIHTQVVIGYVEIDQEDMISRQLSVVWMMNCNWSDKSL